MLSNSISPLAFVVEAWKGEQSIHFLLKFGSQIRPIQKIIVRHVAYSPFSSSGTGLSELNLSREEFCWLFSFSPSGF